MRKRIVAVWLAAGLAAASLTSCQKNGEEVYTKEHPLVFRMSLAEGVNTCHYAGTMAIADKVYEKTDGRILIKVIAGGALGGERDTVELAMQGDLDMVTVANSVLTNWIPEMAILDQAYLWENLEQAHAAVDGRIGDMIEESTRERLGIHVAGYMEAGFRDTFSVKPIDTMEDFRGVKIRTMQNPYQVTAFEAFGAMPTPMAYNEIFTALQQGTIDACENGVSACLTNGFYEITKNVTTSQHLFTYLMVCMSDKAWCMIPEDLKEPFAEGVKEGCEIDRAVLKQAYQEAMGKKGYTFDPEWQAAVDEVIAAYPE
ncbi:MAG: TRAP transporter substrate-binding protein [Lachnospiraceae bacterium]|nr:TRAP transporter substrate-binding protein [Lachnospiraceae bacterium]